MYVLLSYADYKKLFNEYNSDNLGLSSLISDVSEIQ